MSGQTSGRCWFARCGLLLGVVALSASVSRGQYRVQGGITENIGGFFNPISSYDASDSGEIAREVHYDQSFPGEPTYHAQADSIAGIAGLRAHAEAGLSKQASASGFTYRLNSSGAAEAVWSDFVVSAPDGSPSSIYTNFKLHLSGSHLTASTDTPGNSSRGNSIVQISYYTQDQIFGGGSQSVTNADGVQEAPFEQGDLVGFDGDATITTPYVLVPVNTPFSIKLQLQAGAIVEGYFAEGFVASAESDFTHTLTFATGGPVFELPDGYTVNSPSAGIVNNVNTVPEPSLCGCAFLVTPMLAARRGRRG
jgi:hypothetical protein